MKKGTILIIMGNGEDIPDSFFKNFCLPEGCMKYLDGYINVLNLPQGGSIHIGEKSIEVLGGIHGQIHDILDKK